MTDTYIPWELIAKQIAEQKLTSWKTHPSVTYMLEHVGPYPAHVYIDLLRTELPNDVIQRLADVNDRHGGAMRRMINGIYTSPSSMRYLQHSLEICKHIKQKGLTNVTIVEVGGGYGGLALILSEMSKLLGVSIEKYVIYDLPNVQLLQKYYLSLHTMEMPVEWRDCSTYGSDLSSDSTNVLVSCYCISEIPAEFRKQYLQNLLPKCKASFLVWNWGSKEDLPVERDERPEVPDTGGEGKNTVIRL